MSSESGIKKYQFTGKFDTTDLTQFLNDFFSNNLKPALKSEEPLPEDLTGSVVVVKGKSFNDIVINNTKDVFVKFYAPW